MEKIDFSKIRAIHFVGVKGVGMTPLALIAKEAGFVVSGCDSPEIFITDQPLKEKQIFLQYGFSPEHIDEVDLVITTGAHGGLSNPEVIAAKEQGVPVLTQGEALGVFQEGMPFGRHFSGISVAGCHGKTTTTAMIATLFDHSGLDPSYAVGTSMLSPLGFPGHLGDGKYFVAEADEYATDPKADTTPKFLWQHPLVAVITNIEHDHPDIYPTIADTRNAYLKFSQNISKKGLLVACGDDDETRKLLEQYPGRVLTYGFSSHNDYRISQLKVIDHQMQFDIDTGQVSLGTCTVGVVGRHNALNATAAVIVGIECGLPLQSILKGLTVFTGTKRRFEIRGQLATGAFLLDDYAHHPTEIKNTLRAVGDRFVDKKIVCIFQPHTYSRTKLLFDEFASSFIAADEVVLMDIYASAREKPDTSITSEKLATAMRRCNKAVLVLHTLTDVVKYIRQKAYGPEYVIVTMGAGDVYKIGEELLKE